MDETKRAYLEETEYFSAVIDWYKGLVNSTHVKYKIFVSELSYRTAILAEQYTGIKLDNTFYTYNSIEYICDKLVKSYTVFECIDGVLFCDISWHYGRDINKCIHLMESILKSKLSNINDNVVKDRLAKHSGISFIFNTSFKRYINSRYELVYRFISEIQRNKFFDFIGFLYKACDLCNIPLFTHLSFGDKKYKNSKYYVGCDNQYLIILPNIEIEDGINVFDKWIDYISSKSYEYKSELIAILNRYYNYKYYILFSRFIELLISSSLLEMTDNADIIRKHFPDISEHLLNNIVSNPLFNDETELNQFLLSIFKDRNNKYIDNIDEVIYNEGLKEYKYLKHLLKIPFIARYLTNDGFGGITPLSLNDLASETNINNIIKYIKNGIVDCYVLPTYDTKVFSFQETLTIGYLWQILKFPLVFEYSSLLCILYSDCRYRRNNKYKVFDFYCKLNGVDEKIKTSIVEWMKDLDILELEAIDWLVSDLGLLTIPKEKQKSVVLKRMKLRISFEDFIEANKSELNYNNYYSLDFQE